MKFKVRAKLDTKAQNLTFSVPLERAMSSSATRFVEKLQSCAAEIFSVQVSSISIRDSKGEKVIVKNDRQLVKHMLCKPDSVRIYVTKKEVKKKKKNTKTKKTSCCVLTKKSKKKSDKPKKQERKKVNDSDLSDYDCDCKCWVTCDCLDIMDISDSSSCDSDVDMCTDCFGFFSDSDCEFHCDGYDSKRERDVPEATLERGDTGNDVKLLQKHLEDFGFLDEDSYTAGRFGRSTAKAVREFRFAFAVDGSSDKEKYDRATAKALKDLVSDFSDI